MAVSLSRDNARFVPLPGFRLPIPDLILFRPKIMDFDLVYGASRRGAKTFRKQILDIEYLIIYRTILIVSN